MNRCIKVHYKVLNNSVQIADLFNNLPEKFACDFEVAPKLTDSEKQVLYFRLEHNNNMGDNDKKHLEQYIYATGKSYPEFTTITHCNIAWSECNAAVIICDNCLRVQQVLNFLVSTNKKQIWHNTLFDFKHIYYHTGKLPKYYVDTKILAKCLYNNVNSSKDSVKLKHLMGKFYGNWAIAKDEYNLSNMTNKNFLKYCATDACATYKLYQELNNAITYSTSN